MNYYIIKIVESSNNSEAVDQYVGIITHALLRGTHNKNTKAWKQWKEVHGYHELHHIYPSCLCNATEKKDILNYVALTSQEHFLAHKLLCNIFSSQQTQIKMAYAFNGMARDRYGSRILTEEHYAEAREYFSEIRKGIPSPLKGRKGKPVSEETKEKLRQHNLGKKHSQDTKDKCGNAARHPKSAIARQRISDGRKGIIFSEEHKENLSKALKGRAKPPKQNTEQPFLLP